MFLPASNISRRLLLVAAGLLTLGGGLAALPAAAQNVNLLNVSYDPTRELYQQFNAAAPVTAARASRRAR